MDPTLDKLLDRLPEREAPRRLAERLKTEHAAEYQRLKRTPALLANLLTLAAYSPWLGDAMLAQPDIISYIGRKGATDQSRTREQLDEELARYASRNTNRDEQSLLSSFKQRELARIYLRDCLDLATLTETTDELSNLADCILEHALAHVRQTLVNRFGTPQTTDERGRGAEAEFAVVALGKLGNRELNYASDIDLMFLYDGEGRPSVTTHTGKLSPLENRAYFTKLAEELFKTVGSPGRTAPVYRVDLRLRPYGQDGELVVRLERAIEYYRDRAQNWERQMLIRARASAGSEALVGRFLANLRGVIFRAETLPAAIAGVRDSRNKIDSKEKAHGGGFNVKLGPGGIREIEFVAQALQMAYGGQDPWIRASQVLIGLQRLAEKGFISDADRSALSEGYVFLRTVEHRLQMTQGAQTHRLPVNHEELALLGRRCGFEPREGDPAEQLLAAIDGYTSRVRAIASRVFSAGDRPAEPAPEPLAAERTFAHEDRLGREAVEAQRPLESAATMLATLDGAPGEDLVDHSREMRSLLVDVASRMTHPARALRNLERYLASLSTLEPEIAEGVLAGGVDKLEQVVRLLGSGAFFAEILTGQPALAADIPGSLFCTVTRSRSEFHASILEPVAAEGSLATRMAALRRAWYREIVAVGSQDVLGRVPLFEINREQTDLAEAALDVAFRIAATELLGPNCLEPLAVNFLALGRLGHAGMDYGSDLDLLAVYDGDARQDFAGVDASQFYARLAQLVARVLSALTREGYVYRVDFRLRPEGRAGRMASSMRRLDEYIRERASAWELTAYLKVRPVAGDAEVGERARAEVIASVFEASRSRWSLDDVRSELSDVRSALERDRGRKGRNIKWGRGGMLDVYFVTRYAQLGTQTDFPPQMGTRALIAHLGEAGILSAEDAVALGSGYEFLRRIDHALRLIGDRAEAALPEEPELLEEVATYCDISQIWEFEMRFRDATGGIRAVYDKVFG